MSLIHNDLIVLGWVQLWQVTVLATAVAALTRLVLRKRPRLAYLLWMIVIFKAITPPIWSSSTSIFSWAQLTPKVATTVTLEGVPATENAIPVSSAAPQVRRETKSEKSAPPDVVPESRTVPVETLPEGVARAARSNRRDWADRLFVLWLVGTCAFSILISAKWLHLRSRLHSTKCGEKELAIQKQIAHLTSMVGVRRPVRVCITASNLGPAVVGWLRPVILLPEALLKAKSLEELEPIVIHELVHVRRGDTLVGQLQVLIQVLWWFHPLIWWANREARRERERCVDEEVVSGFRCQPTRYARALLDTEVLLGPLRQNFASAGTHLTNVNFERLEEIMNRSHQFREKTPIRYWLLAATVCLLVLPGRALTTSVAAQDQTEGEVDLVVSRIEVGQKVTPFKALSVRKTDLNEKTIADTGGPAVICFISRATENTLDLIRTVEHYASRQEGLSRDYVFFASAFHSEDRDKIVSGLRGSFPKLSPSVSLDKGPKEFGLSHDAGLTVLVTNEGRIVKRFAFADVQLFRDGEGILKAVSEQVNKPVPSLAMIHEEHRKDRRAWYEREARRTGRSGKEQVRGPSPDGE